MEAKLFAYLLVVAALVGLTYGIYYTQDIDDLSRQLTSLDNQIEGLTKQVQTQKQQLDLRREASALIDATTATEAQAKAVTAEIEALKDERPRMAEEMTQAVAKVRKASVGLAFPELLLAKGPPLKDVRIQRVDEEVVTFQHAEGVSRAKVDDLPAQLRDRLRLQKIVPKEPATPVAQPAPVPEAAPAPAERSASPHEKKLIEARLAKERIAKELPHVKSSLDQAEMDLTAATSASRKFYAKARRDQLSAQYLALKRSLDAADLALQRLEAEAP